MAQQTSFEQQWRGRFQRFATDGIEDADIAGWSRSGLRARVVRFRELWRPSPLEGLWLDAGCGAGTYSRLLIQHAMQVVGMDYSLPSIAKARLKSEPAIAWVAGDATRIPLKSECVDGVLCLGVTQALSDSEMLVRELVRVARPGGEIWIDALNKWCLPHAFGSWVRRLRRRPLHLRYEATSRLKQLMQSQGLTDVSVYWLPIVPGSWPHLQAFIETRLIRWLFDHVPGIGPLLSHSVILRGMRPKASVH